MNKNHKRISAAVLALALGFSTAGAGIFAPVAGAQIGANQISTVNLDADVSLTIEKYRGLPIEDPANNLDTIAGVDFRIQKVTDVDLSTTAGWGAVADLIAGTADPSFDSGFGEVTLTTGANGQASITNNAATGPAGAIENSAFTVGVYLVTEQPLDNHTIGEPFFVTLPFTDPSSGIWEYKQTVQPKNQQDINIEKDVDDRGVTLGEEITYTISAPLPAGDLTELQVVDNLQSELGQADAFNVYVDYLADGTKASESFERNTDYTVSGNFELTFTDEGLAKLQTLSDGEENTQLELFVEFKTQVESLPADGVIENHASIDLGGGLRYSTDPEDPEDPGTGTETRLGQLTVTKVKENGTALTVEDSDSASASFELWLCSLDTETEKWTVEGTALPVITDGTVTTTDDLDAYIAEHGADGEMPTEFSTDPDNGTATLYGVQTFNYVNDEETEDSNFCLVETKAPEGFTLNPEPTPVETYANPTNPDASNYAMTANVINLDDTIDGQLPSTGGQGTMAMIAGGLLVAVAGGFAALRGNRARG